MIAVIFEVTPAEGRFQEYMDLVAQLKPELDRADGFISIAERKSATLGRTALLSLPTLL
jgi:heme-degrading monooxygenase HmoA